MKSPRNWLVLVAVILVVIGVRVLWFPAFRDGNDDTRKSSGNGELVPGGIPGGSAKTPVHKAKPAKQIPKIRELGNLTEKECEDRIAKLLTDEGESRSLRALQLLQIARADNIPEDLREESFAHALNLLEDEDIMYLLPMASSKDTPPQMLQGIMGTARNHPVHKEAMELALAILKNPANPEPSNASEFIAFLLDVDAESPAAELIYEADRVLGVWPDDVDDVSEVMKQFPQDPKAAPPKPAPVK